MCFKEMQYRIYIIIKYLYLTHSQPVYNILVLLTPVVATIFASFCKSVIVLELIVLESCSNP